MKKGFDFLKTNVGQESYDLSSIVQLPKLYLLFVDTYEVNSECLKIDGILDQDGDFAQIGSVKINTSNNHNGIYLNNFMDSSDILKQWDGSKEDTEWTEHTLLRIAYLGQAGFGGLYLGCGDHNADEIWNFNADNDPQFIKLDDNIFEFIKRLEFSTDFSNIENEKYDSLYKKWGEGVWQIKE